MTLTRLLAAWILIAAALLGPAHAQDDKPTPPEDVFRYVIFDATPAQFGAETTFLTSMVDSVLLVVRAGKTARDDIMEAIENIGRKKIFGIVFNASSEHPRGYKYYYRYYREGHK